MTQIATVRNLSSHVEDVADGRVIEPGGSLEGVDVDDAHNKAKIKDGALSVIEEPQPLSGKALQDRAKALEIEGYSTMKADELRDAVAAAEAGDSDNEEENQ